MKNSVNYDSSQYMQWFMHRIQHTNELYNWPVPCTLPGSYSGSFKIAIPYTFEFTYIVS